LVKPLSLFKPDKQAVTDKITSFKQ